jgi:hypothetical protein
MSEGEERPQTSESDDASQNPAQGTPPIGDDEQTPGQTQTPSADDDVGVPDDPGADTAGT